MSSDDAAPRRAEDPADDAAAPHEDADGPSASESRASGSGTAVPSASESRDSDPRAAERTRVLLAGVLAAALGALAASRGWTSTAETGHAGLTATTVQSGTDLASWALPCALAGGAAFLAMLATGNRARRVLGAVAALAGLAAALGGVLHLTAGAWPIVLAAAGLILAGAGAWTTARAGAWPATDRYEASPAGGAAIAEDPVSLWNALDSGQDPSSPTITASAQEKGPRR
ncbi:Tryptophan-associated transmembrane protein (Trp_oprn_chp) [Glycomyces sambucus]|uniref:Tryptophan-associated transmembrane protein (Trp_oprn_chp) n=1 Tax=Glycomyces sambucus TaxID=380244 RepID=A0A1G9DIK4_9ACTN|nr:Trp biosynthesis-associated membrane protein [Glycomyces sambucus]SDK63650.1 Tryptophan-associated transmembrane protein (Trp_oprn_chp) [Glycomyces sambucus]